MAQIEDASTTLSKQTPTGFTLDVSSNPQGKQIEDALKDQLANDIGTDRADFLMNSQRASYNDPFSGFGQQKIQWEVSWAEQNGALLYSWKQTGFGAEGQNSGSNWSSGTSLPPDLQKFVEQPNGH